MTYVLIISELNLPNDPLLATGVMWTVYATNIGYSRQLGSGNKIRHLARAEIIAKTRQLGHIC
jgi:hypothetical protein